METVLEVTTEDLVKEPEEDYANFNSENRVFIIFNPISPAMMKLNEGDKFVYQGERYRIKMRMPEEIKPSDTIQFNCLKINKVTEK